MSRTSKRAQPTEVLEVASYPTLYHQKKARLLAVGQVWTTNESFDMLRLAVPARPRETLGNGPLLQLVFVGEKNIPFAVLRNWEGWLNDYYKARIDMVFTIKTEVR